MGEVIRFPSEEALRRDLRRLRIQVSALQTCANIRRAHEEAERAVASAPPGARATAFLQNRDPGDEDGQ